MEQPRCILLASQLKGFEKHFLHWNPVGSTVTFQVSKRQCVRYIDLNLLITMHEVAIATQTRVAGYSDQSGYILSGLIQFIKYLGLNWISALDHSSRALIVVCDRSISPDSSQDC